MAAAVVMHAVSILAVMIPSFFSIISINAVLPEPHDLVYSLGAIHAVAGISAFLLGVWLVAAWRFSKNVQGCLRRKKFMLATLAVWFTAVGLGFVLFAIFYGPLL